MAEYGVTPTGFKRKRYVDILADMQSRAKTNFGDNVVVDTNKPLGKFLDINAWGLAEAWEVLEDLYTSISVETAEDAALDVVVKYKDLTRIIASAATGTIRITGTSGTLISTGFMVGKDDNTTYSTTVDGTIGSTGYIDLPIVCNYQGSRGNAEIGEISQIVTPLFGVTSVSNQAIITNGYDNETDPELRQRYYATVGSISNVETINVAVSKVEGVVSSFVIENTTMDTVDGIPPKSFVVYAYGGDNQKIADAIFSSKAAGIQAYGDVTVTVYDENGNPYTIGFMRPTAIQIDVEVTLTVNQFFSLTDVDILKNNIIKYIGGNDVDGTQYDGLGIKKNVIRGYINSLAWQLKGVIDASTLLAKHGETLLEQNITIGEDEIARASIENIVVEVVLE